MPREWEVKSFSIGKIRSGMSFNIDIDYIKKNLKKTKKRGNAIKCQENGI